MTTSTTSNKERFNGNGVTVDFPADIKIFSEDDIDVQIVDSSSNAVINTLVLNDAGSLGFSVNFNTEAETLTVTTVTAPASGEDLFILRSLPITQTSDFPTASKLSASSIEDALDKNTLVIQDQQEVLDRALTFLPTATATSGNILGAEDGKLLRWNADGDIDNVLVADLTGQTFDTTFTSLQDNDFLVYKSASQSFENGSISTFGVFVKNENETVSGNNTFTGTNDFSGDVSFSARHDVDVPSATFFDATASDGQLNDGATVYVTNRTNSNANFSQLAFGLRSDGYKCRIAATGGTTPRMSFVFGVNERFNFTNTGNLEADGTVTASNINNVVYAQTNARTTSTAVIPFDDTVPQSTEGEEFLTASITPSSATAKILVRITHSSSANGLRIITTALFRDSLSDAITAKSESATGNGTLSNNVIEFLDSPATTSEVDYSVRVGVNSGTLYFNGSSVDYLGGTAVATLTLTEI